MKNLPIIFATALLALLSASCTSGGDEPPSISSDSQNNAGDFEMSGQVINVKTQKPYTGSGKIYMAERRNSKGNLILTEETMLLVGTMKNGEIAFDLPTVDSRFLLGVGNVPAGMEVEPLSAKGLIYTDAFRLIDDNGKHIGDIRYAKESDDENHRISYCYFSEDVKMNGTIRYDDEDGTTMKYEMETKKGWNKFYWSANKNTHSVLETTDLSKVSNGLIWMLWEVPYDDSLDGTNYEVSEKEDCNGVEYNPKIKFCSAGTVKDKGEFEDKRDGKKYKTVVIGNQTWMAENLNYEKIDSKCYDNNSENCKKCGRLYNWFTATTKEICPEGWRLPNNDDWEALHRTAGGSREAATRLKTKSGWKLCNSAGDKCTDDYGFSALACGGASLIHDRYYFSSLGSANSFWSFTESSYEDWAYNYSPGSLDPTSDKESLKSVRCIKK
ncbi:MAG: hypothetical protein LBC75_06435 [Fibromonadaceae bacterium]|jgi:uncharacterized protein (TIGR02145 family)|nr:hypothetical protein [Fibromonadaceae bacterium]